MHMERPATTKRNQYDSVFRMLFHKPEALQELYNAVSGSTHTDTSQLYSTRPMELPFPVFIVFYNGREEVPEQRDYYLSELYFSTPLPPNLDLRVRVLNINPGYNEELVASSPYLWGYQIYTDKVRRYSLNSPLEQAVERAVAECIEEGILKEFLLENKKEVMDMSIFEFDQQMYIKVQTDEAREDGIQIGLEQGETRMELLCKHLLSKQRYDELERATSDKAYRQQLYQQYGIA